MTADLPAGVAVIDRMAVRWQAHGFTGVGSTVAAEPGERLIDPARLDRLIDELLAGPLHDALAATAIGRDQLVCLRSVTVPATTVWWDRPDADAVATWAAAVADAVAESVGRSSSSDDVVRYRSREQAVVDLVVHAVVGDMRRAWAWRQIGLWPTAHPVEAMTTGESATVAAEVLADHPEQIVAVLAALAAAGRLPEAVDRWGVERTVALVAAAWVAHGGDRRIVTGDHLEVSSRGPVHAPADTTVAQSIIARTAVVAMGAPAHGFVGGSGPEGTSGLTQAGRGPARLAWALAAAAVLDAEPVVVSRTPVASAAVAALTGRLIGAKAGSEIARTAEAAERGELPQPTIDRSDDVEAIPRDAPVDEPATDELLAGAAGASGDLVPTGTTPWGGLLFLLHVVGDLADEADDPAEPVLTWPPTALALHRVAHTLASRALPDMDPPRPDDPAVLAFAGLAPDAAPPEPGSDHQPPVAAHARADAIVAALRARLVGSTVGAAPEPALLAAVLRRAATITADPGWLDVELDLDQICVVVRRAGLDLDPGWIPWLGRVVRFRYA